MTSENQKQLIKYLLYNWSQNGVNYLLIDHESMKKVCDNINVFVKYKKILDSSEQDLNVKNLAMTIMTNCPNIIWHYNPTEEKINLNFDEEEKRELLSNIGEKIISKRDEIEELSHMITSSSENCFTFKSKIKK